MWINILSVIVGVQFLLILFLFWRMRVIKEIFDDHKQNIEFLAHRQGAVQKLLNMKEEDF